MSKRIYVGLDVHLNSIVAVWQTAGGRAHWMVVEPTEEGFERLSQAVQGHEVWAAYEASSCGWEAHDELSRRGWKVFVLAPTHLPKSVKSRKRKNDREDAQMLLQVLMGHGELGSKLPAVWVPGQRVREDREIVRRRLAVGEKLGRVKAEIRSLLRMHRVKTPGTLKSPWTQKYQAWLTGLCGAEGTLGASVKEGLASQVRELKFFQEESERLQGAIEKLSQEEAYRGATERMTRRQGVATLTAMTYLLEMGDVNRFKNRQQVGCYLGLVPTSDESGEQNNRKGHITRMGPARIRKVLNQAAWACLTFDETLRAWYKPLAERRGKKIAIVAVMRRLGIELWREAKSA